MACFCVHHTVLKANPFKCMYEADLYFVNDLTAKGFRHRYIDLPIGVWLNYGGNKFGADTSCGATDLARLMGIVGETLRGA